VNEIAAPVTVLAACDFAELEGPLQTVGERLADVTERVPLGRQRALSVEQQAALGHPAASMAHELRNPLIASKVLVQVARRQRTAAGSA
jgi:hypothetical protein